MTNHDLLAALQESVDRARGVKRDAPTEPPADPQPVNADLRNRLRAYPGDGDHQAPAAIGDDETVPCCRATGYELREGDGHRFGCDAEESPVAPLPVTLSSPDDVACAADGPGEACTCRSDEPCLGELCDDSACRAVGAAIEAARGGSR